MNEEIIFKNREDAGIQLAEKLKKFKNKDTIIFALPRGGVVLGKIISEALHSPLDLIIVRKIGHPENPEYAIGAITETGPAILNEAESVNINNSWLLKQEEIEKNEIKRRRIKYLNGQSSVDAKNKTAIIVDDGIATGYTMLAALIELRRRGLKKIIAAVPIAPSEAAEIIRNEADEFISLYLTDNFRGSIGSYYLDFPQLSDEEVIRLLKK